MSAAKGAAQPRATRLLLSEFRSYPALDWSIEADLVALAGPNGAGKTNLLEALSLLAPGRGLRRAALPNLVRRGAGGFHIYAEIETVIGPRSLATGLEFPDAPRRCRIDREPVGSANAFLDCLAMLWLTPDQDGLFRGPAGDRRRFLDRLVLALDTAHAARAAAYETALRHRNRLLDDGAEARWLDAIEIEAAELGVALTAARQEAVARLDGLAGTASAGAAFPHARLRLEGDLESALAEGLPAGEVEDRFRRALRDGRSRDRAAGRTIVGPQASDLRVIHGPKEEPAETCSTGEQKALLIGIILAQAELVRQWRGEAPVLLLDEIAAHLDEARREGLYARLAALGGQAFMTGTDPMLFSALPAAGLCYSVGEGSVRATGRPIA